MTYDEFTKMILSRIESTLLPGQTAKLQTVLKNNDTYRISLLIKDEKSNMAPAIYLDTFYEAYEDAVTDEDKEKELTKICDTIFRMQNSETHPDTIDTKLLFDLSFFKERLCCRLISTNKNKHLLKDTPHIPYWDYSIVFFLYLGLSNGSNGSILLKEEHLKRFPFSLDELFAIARKNTEKLLPAVFFTISDISFDKKGLPHTGFSYIDLDKEEKMQDEKPPCGFYVLSNKQQFHGAISILSPGILEKISNYLKSGFFLIPSSVHEFLIIPSDTLENFCSLNQILCDVNETEIMAEEYLGERCLYFDYSTKSLTIPDYSM